MRSRKKSDKPVTIDNRPRESGRNPRQTIQVKVAERPNLGRHAANCGICSHALRQEIEEEFVAWGRPTKIAQEFGLRDRSSVYRHAHALGLSEKRRRNVRAALERIIEQAGDVEANAGAIVAAVQAYAKINSRGESIEREDHFELQDLFDRMNRDELEAYAKDGTLPNWFQEEIVAAGGRVPKGADDE